jgi:DNA-binding NarL/FixJ family response regulator
VEDVLRFATEDGDPPASHRYSSWKRSNGMTAPERDRQISLRLVQGSGPAEIAGDLNIPTRTVKGRMRRLFMANGLICFHGNKHLKLAALLLDGGEFEPVMIGADMRHLLNDRERRIAGGVANCLTNAQIGVALGISEQVVKNALRKVYDTTGMDNRLGLMLWWRAHGGTA